MNRAVFLDRDGVINAAPYNPAEGKRDSPYSVSEFRLLPGAKRAVRLLNEAGWLTVLVSNQPGVAKGKCTTGVLDELTECLKERLAEAGGHLDGIYYCLHHPDAVVPELRVALRLPEAASRITFGGGPGFPDRSDQVVHDR